jgi:hypothetical protein
VLTRFLRIRAACFAQRQLRYQLSTKMLPWRPGSIQYEPLLVLPVPASGFSGIPVDLAQGSGLMAFW